MAQASQRAIERVLQLAHAGDVPAAVSQLEAALQDEPGAPRLWYILGSLLSEGSPSDVRYVNPSGHQPTVSILDPKRALGAFIAACSLSRLHGDTATLHASRENLQRLHRRALGYSSANVIEALWDTDRSQFLTSEIHHAAPRLRKIGSVAAVVVDGLGWEAPWISQNSATLGISSVYSVRGRTQALGAVESALGEMNRCSIFACSWADLPGCMEMTKPAAVIVVLASCLAPFPSSPRSVLAEVEKLASVLQEPELAFIPSSVSWRGGMAKGSDLKLSGVVQTDAFMAEGLEYKLARERLRPRYHWIQLADAVATWQDDLLAMVTLLDVWHKVKSAEGVAEDAVEFSERPREAEESDAFIWWHVAGSNRPGGHGADALARGVSCAPRRGPLRTWQVAVFGDGLLTETTASLLMALESAQRFRAYHVSMLNDEERTAYYSAATRAAVAAFASARGGEDGPALNALDIGAGTGLLSLLTARHAQQAAVPLKLVAVEAERHLAELASELACVNGFTADIRVVQALSTNLCARPAEERAQICVHEIFGSDPLSERVLPALRHARANLLAPDAILVPSSFMVVCRICRSGELDCLFRPPSSVQGVPHVGEAFQELSPVVEALHIGEGGATWLSPAVDAAECDLHELLDKVPVERTVTIRGPGAESGSGGIFVSFWFRLGGAAHLETGPSSGLSRPWAPCFQLLSGCDAQLFTMPFVAELSVQISDDRLRFSLSSVSLEDEVCEGLEDLFSDDGDG